MTSILSALLGVLPWVAVIGVIVVIFGASYVKAPPNMAYIISGLKKGKEGEQNGRVVVGTSAIRIPFLERLDKLSLGIMQVDIKTRADIPTAEYINVFIDGIANIKVSTKNDQSILRASQLFLSCTKEDISKMVQEILEGNFREIVGQMKLSELIQNTDIFTQKVEARVVDEMAKMGLEIVNINIQSITDKVKAIENLGIDNVVRLSKDAAIARATAEKEIAIAQAQAAEEANASKAAAAKKIAEQDKNVEIARSEYKKEMDTQKAIADASYNIQTQEQRKTIETASVNADIARREKEAELADKEIALTERRLDAEIKKKADADKYAIQQKADADKYRREQEALALKIEQTNQAEADKITASAERFANEERAKGIEAVGLAEAKAIEAKAEAMKLMEDAAVLDMYFKVLPEIVKNAAAPLENVDKITMYGEGNSAKMVKDVMNSSNQIIEGLKDTTGIDIKGLLESFVSKTNNE